MLNLEAKERVLNEVAAFFGVDDTLHTSFTEAVDFARTKLAGNTKQTKQCKKGYSCGYSCISKSKNCRSTLVGQAKTYADWIASQAKSKISVPRRKKLVEQAERKLTKLEQQYSSLDISKQFALDKALLLVSSSSLFASKERSILDEIRQTRNDLNDKRRRLQYAIDEQVNPSFAESSDESDIVDRATQQALESTDFGNWLTPIKQLLENGNSLEEVRDRLFDLYPQLPPGDFAEVMGNAIAASELAGRYEVIQEGQEDPELVEASEQALDLEESVDFARTKLAGNTKQVKQCEKGWSCGYSCISRLKNCRSTLTGQAKTYADWMAKQVKSGTDQPQLNTSPKTHQEHIENGRKIAGEAFFAEAKVAQERYAEIDKRELEDVRGRVDRETDFVLRDKLIRDFEKQDPIISAFRQERESIDQIGLKLYDRLLNESSLTSEQAQTLAAKVKLPRSAKEEAPELQGTIADIYRLTNGQGSESLKKIKFIPDGQRAYAHQDKGLVAIRKNEKSSVLYHEMGHHAEYAGSVQTSKDWIKSRAEGEPARLNTLTNVRYRPDETAYPDHFVDPYVGKIYPSATEVISMGLESFSSPRLMVKLAATDPDHFAYTVGVLRNPAAAKSNV